MNTERPVMSRASFLRHKSRFLTGVLLTACLLWEGLPHTSSAEESDRKQPLVIAYLPEYRLADFSADRLEGLTDLVLFSIEPKASGELDTARLKPETIRKVVAACREKSVRVTIALGGWERSRGFVKMAADRATRERFAKNLVKYCLDNHLAGADFDWEHPHNSAEEQSYADLMIETKRQFESQKLTLSAALAGWQNVPAAGLEALDRVHLMAYDHDEPRHASLELVQSDIKQVLDRPGMSPGKLFVGIPCYARNMKKRSESITYAEIVDRYRPAGNVDETEGWYFNGLAQSGRKPGSYAIGSSAVSCSGNSARMRPASRR